MDTISSGEFRKTYGKLLRPTVVTANGHPIGVWEPYKGSSENEDRWRGALGVEPLDDRFMLVDKFELEPDRFNTRPFTPVPKKGK